jgi:hypothetical protein
MSAYVTHILRLKDRIFEGKDERTSKQQYDDISTIGVMVPNTWRP